MKIDLTLTGLDYAQAQNIMKQLSGETAHESTPKTFDGQPALPPKVEVRKSKPAPVPTAVVEASAETTIDAKQVKTAASKFMATYGMDELTERLVRFGATKLSDLGPNNFAAFLATLTAPAEPEAVEGESSLLD